MNRLLFFPNALTDIGASGVSLVSCHVFTRSHLDISKVSKLPPQRKSSQYSQ